MTNSARIFRPAAALVWVALFPVLLACAKGEPSAAGAGGAEGSAAAPAQPTAGTAVPAATPASTATPGAGTTPPGANPGAAAEPPVDPAQLPAVVAKIDGAEVTKSDLLSRATEARGALVQRGVAPPPATMSFYRKVLDDVIGNRLLYRELSSQGKTAPAADVDQRLAAIRAQFPSEEAFNQSLAARGFDLDRLRRELTEGMTVSRWVTQTVMPSIQIEESELKKYYDANTEMMVEPEKTHARHVLVAVDPKATEEELAAKRKRAEELRSRLAGGADFAALAKEASDDKQSAARGGDLGWMYKGQTVPAFDTALSELEIGKLSEIVTTRFGFHLVEVLERKQATKLDFAAARPRIEQIAKQRRLEEAVRAKVSELAGKSKIEILL